MFVFGKKKKLEEFVQHLADLGNISIEEAQEYCVKNRALILNAFSRGLDPFSGVAYISEINMEKIQIIIRVVNMQVYQPHTIRRI